MSKFQDKLDLAARAAWLYYVAGNTQSEIAERLNISRPVAQRLVAFAAEHGLVKVRVHHRVGECLELAKALSARYGLERCEVVPSDHDTADELQRKLAVAGAGLMEEFIGRESPSVIGLGSGRTLKAVVDELSEIERPQHRLVSLVGTIAHDGSSNPYDVALRTAEKTKSKYFLLPAPVYADSAEDRRQWCNHRLFRVVEELARQADVAFIGIGDIGPNCPLHADGFLTDAELEELLAHQVVGEVVGRPVGPDGQPVRLPILDRVTSLPLSSPPAYPVIAFAGGPAKADAIRAALRGRWISGLVTDAYCARHALEDS